MEIKADILEHGLRQDGVLRQHYDTDALDASTLLAAVFGFLPADDPRLRASVLAIADELTEDGFVLRYRTEETDDGLSGKEGTFLICSFWLVSALAIVGERQRARDLMERLLGIASTTPSLIFPDAPLIPRDVPGFEIPSRFFRFVRSGDAHPLEAVLEHNRLDLVSLAAVTGRAARLHGGKTIFIGR